MNDDRTITSRSNIIVLDNYRPAIDGRDPPGTSLDSEDDEFPLREDLTPEEDRAIIERMALLEELEEGESPTHDHSDEPIPPSPDPRLKP